MKEILRTDQLSQLPLTDFDRAQVAAQLQEARERRQQVIASAAADLSGPGREAYLSLPEYLQAGLGMMTPGTKEARIHRLPC